MEKKLQLVKTRIQNAAIQSGRNQNNITIVAVTKSFPPQIWNTALHHQLTSIGESKIQEAENKWLDVKNKYKDLQLHMVGKLQSNKAKKAVKLFDYIHSLDSAKLAIKISKYTKELNKEIKLFIQVNLADETQKSGILLKDLNSFYNFCRKKLSLNIIGLMCLPPISSDSDKFFKILKNTSEKLNLTNLSMGMSSDYEQAILNGATHLRLGTAILGERNT